MSGSIDGSGFSGSTLISVIHLKFCDEAVVMCGDWGCR